MSLSQQLDSGNPKNIPGASVTVNFPVGPAPRKTKTNAPTIIQGRYSPKFMLFFLERFLGIMLGKVHTI